MTDDKWIQGIPRFTRGSRLVAVAGLSLGTLLACSNDDKDKTETPPEGSEGPFQSLEAAANSPGTFTQSRAGVPLGDGSVAFIATVEGLTEEETTESGERVGVLLQSADGGDPTPLYVGDKLVNPLDLDVSLDGETLYIADSAAGVDGEGAILTLPVAGGEPVEALLGGSPRSVTVGPDENVYFSGIDVETGDPGVFRVAGSAAEAVFTGAPLVDPSGVAVLEDGRILVADTRLFDALPEDTSETFGNEAGIVLIADGQASIFATGFATGYPAGIALTMDEKSLIISGEGPDRSDTVYIVDMAQPDAPPTVVTHEAFSGFKDSSGGLKRAHDTNTFIWASLAAGGGTVFKIIAK